MNCWAKAFQPYSSVFFHFTVTNSLFSIIWCRIFSTPKQVGYHLLFIFVLNAFNEHVILLCYKMKFNRALGWLDKHTLFPWYLTLVHLHHKKRNKMMLIAFSILLQFGIVLSLFHFFARICCISSWKIYKYFLRILNSGWLDGWNAFVRFDTKNFASTKATLPLAKNNVSYFVADEHFTWIIHASDMNHWKWNVNSVCAKKRAAYQTR